MITFVFVLAFCGCKNEKGVKVRTELLSFSCNISYGNEKYAFDVKTTKKNGLSCTATSPESIKGMVFGINRDTVTVNYLGMEIEKGLDDIPYGNIIGMFYKIMEEANGKTASKNDKNYSLSGKIRKTEYQLCVSPAGLPISLNLPNEKIYMEFNNLTLVKT